MEGIRSSTRSRDLLRKIKEFTLSILEALSEGRSPLIFIQSFRTYCTNLDSICSCRSNKPSGHEILTFQKESHVHRIDVLLRVLLIVQQLLQENKHASKRDIYYMHPLIFSDQSVVDRAINDICILLQCSRHNLNVVSVGNGLVMGWLRFFEAGRKFDCINSPNTVRMGEWPIQFLCLLRMLKVTNKYLVSAALYILVVEKESGKRLSGCSHKKVKERFLRLLMDKLSLPVYCLVDCDPYGFDILATYRFGSMQMAYDAKFLRVPQIQWLGAFPSDSENYDLPKQCLLPLTIEASPDCQIRGKLKPCYRDATFTKKCQIGGRIS
ncbi:meiotic recombination protein SPO11-1 isoform X6 [Gossypium australe]|uniref:DNA topoisomerase (ATP-hydrolyzing) n=1 Tax=Gossypium australe TaxID=47621 RepID=A0A5B6VEA1_9ROSI|nr:meiotic recombination protein SPO11-1 isoform X6 [Gossypium australe]